MLKFKFFKIILILMLFWKKVQLQQVFPSDYQKIILIKNQQIPNSIVSSKDGTLLAVSYFDKILIYSGINQELIRNVAFSQYQRYTIFGAYIYSHDLKVDFAINNTVLITILTYDYLSSNKSLNYIRISLFNLNDQNPIDLQLRVYGSIFNNIVSHVVLQDRYLIFKTFQNKIIRLDILTKAINQISSISGLNITYINNFYVDLGSPFQKYVLIRTYDPSLVIWNMQMYDIETQTIFHNFNINLNQNPRTKEKGALVMQDKKTKKTLFFQFLIQSINITKVYKHDLNSYIQTRITTRILIDTLNYYDPFLFRKMDTKRVSFRANFNYTDFIFYVYNIFKGVIQRDLYLNNTNPALPVYTPRYYDLWFYQSKQISYYIMQFWITCINYIPLPVELNCEFPLIADYQLQICRLCNSICATCVQQSPDECETCNSYFNLQNGTCIPECEFPLIADYQLQICRLCNSICATCIQQNPDECKTCNSYFNLQNGICIPSQFASTVLNLASIPNIESFLTFFGAFFTFLDDFWLYQYHNRQYPASLVQVFNYLKTIKELKLIPRILPIPYNKPSIFQKDTNSSKYQFAPKNYKNVAKQGISFLRVGQDLYLWNTVSNFVGFIIFFLFAQLLKFTPFAGVTAKYRMLGWILVAMVQVNIQYSTFLFFWQIKIPFQNKFFDKGSIILASFHFFISFVAALCVHFFFWYSYQQRITSSKQIQTQTEKRKQTIKSINKLKNFQSLKKVLNENNSKCQLKSIVSIQINNENLLQPKPQQQISKQKVMTVSVQNFQNKVKDQIQYTDEIKAFCRLYSCHYKSLIYINITIGVKGVIGGFIHSYLYDDYILQMWCLNVVTIFMLLSTFLLFQAFPFKIIGVIHLIYFVLRFILDTLFIVSYQGVTQVFGLSIQQIEKYILYGIIYWSILKVLCQFFIFSARVFQKGKQMCLKNNKVTDQFQNVKEKRNLNIDQNINLDNGINSLYTIKRNENQVIFIQNHSFLSKLSEKNSQRSNKKQDIQENSNHNNLKNNISIKKISQKIVEQDNQKDQKQFKKQTKKSIKPQKTIKLKSVKKIKTEKSVPKQIMIITKREIQNKGKQAQQEEDLQIQSYELKKVNQLIKNKQKKQLKLNQAKSIKIINEKEIMNKY